MDNILQIIRYSYVGIIVNILCYLIYLALSNLLNIFPPLSAVLSGFVGIILSYNLHRKFSFRSSSRGLKTFFDFSASYSLAIIANATIILIFSSVLEFRHEYVALMSLLITSLTLFLVQRIIIFKE